MKKELKKHIGSLLWVVFLFSCVISSRAETNSSALNKLLASKGLDKNQTALYIWDIEKSKEVASYRASQPIIPASIMKCASVGALKYLLDDNDELNIISTDVLLEGEQKGETFTGNIVVLGNGDPSLGDGRHEERNVFVESIAEALEDRNIKKIYGKVIIDDSLFPAPFTPPSWDKSDLNHWYGTGCHAFNYEGNVSGKTAVGNPSSTFIARLKKELAAREIELVEKAVVTDDNRSVLLLSHDSPEMTRLMSSCMFRSDNLYAEAFLRLFSLASGGDATPVSGASLERKLWKQLEYPLKGVEIVDGSGLSRENRITAEFLHHVLLGLSDDPEYVSFFPLAGEEGTVKNFLKDTPLQGYLALKTGSMNGIQSYAGYLLDEDFYPTHTVVVVANNIKDRAVFRKDLAAYFLSVFN